MRVGEAVRRGVRPGAGADAEVRLAREGAVLGDEAGVDEADAPPAVGEAVAQLGRGLEEAAAADDDLLAIAGQLFDALYEYRKRALLLGREPA